MANSSPSSASLVHALSSHSPHWLELLHSSPPPDLGAVDSHGRSLLMLAAKWGNKEAVQELLACPGIDSIIQKEKRGSNASAVTMA